MMQHLLKHKENVIYVFAMSHNPNAPISVVETSITFICMLLSVRHV